MSKLSDRVEARIRAEWPGDRSTDRHGLSVVPPVRPGGLTDSLIILAAQIVAEEEERELRLLRDQIWSSEHERHMHDPFEGAEDG